MSPLSSDELRTIREELSAGTTPTVWFTSSAVGVQEGRSGKVIALGEPAEGDFIQVRPAGSKDVLSFSTAEVTQVKPPRKKPTPEPAAKPAAKTPASTPSPVTATKPAEKPAAKPAPAPAAKPSTQATAKPADAAAARRKPRQVKQPVGGAVVTLTADQDGQWSVEVANAKRKLVKPTQVPANAVAQAAKLLHDDVAAAVEPLIEAAREQHRARVEQLRAELEAAEAALEELDE
ncbi:DUF6319 family protein [Saccharopolyspora endophytica]|uniref:Cell wall anchor protein n=1 Tax=Saccharopolyspora endophytica TaxID=543886 RepID=A0ABS5DG23_9PSEU|nr:DUF6319 family protein [Saccharopolyspora endophytica]MBQ0925233.1 cell wall anchor protein [Saccharopolyspora endophytica]